MIQNSELTFSSYALEEVSGVIRPLGQFPDLAALFSELIIANKEEQRRQHKRTRKERAECINFHGTKCAVCGFSFEQEFGEIGMGYIEVHHLKPVAQYAGFQVRIVNPIADLRPVCANCHRMLHTKNPPYCIEEMIEIRARKQASI
jgi:predicted HNH restriction endonuclease